jgi:hypothetical protein
MHDNGTMALMTPPKKKGSRGKPRTETPPPVSRLFIEMDEGVKRALEQYAGDEGRTLKAQVERILREFLGAKGYYPTPPVRPG